MAARRVAEALLRLGVSAEATRVYDALLDCGPAALDHVAKLADLDAGDLASAYEELLGHGLVSAADREGVVAPQPPGLSLEVLARRRTAEIEESRLAVASAFEVFRRLGHPASRHDLVEVVTGPLIGIRMQQAWRTAREQIRQLDSPPYFDVPGGLDDALETLRRGVRQRIVYTRDSLTYPGMLKDNIETCIAAGEEGRVVASVPVKMIIIDDRVALVSLAISKADVVSTMLVVQPCGLLYALEELFEHTWNTALPFHDQDVGPRQLLPADRKLLSLLAAGVTDEEIARELGISRRTLYRRVEILSARLGAATRFQMALLAQRRGWV
ncbi:helix-turn-helix domain-containing protein [Actinokineospora soli]|uniref:Helix-turn-helix domain-containing protein n=1 Tax=Actinokineospora soli TaxID=1048753 RepID=A0ABW2TS03_9PSEU